MVKGGGSLDKGSVKKRLSDITNLQQSRRTSPAKGEISPGRNIIDPAAKASIDRLLKENLTLLKHLDEKSKLVEQSGMELRNLGVILQRMQLQNLQLAQTNTHMLSELNLGKEKLRALEHELACKDSLLKAMSVELQHKTELDRRKDIGSLRIEFRGAERADDKSQPNVDKKKTSDSSKRHTARSCRSLTRSTASQTVQGKGMDEENKSRCFRRQSLPAKVKCHDLKDDDLFEIDVANFPLRRSQSMNQIAEAKSSSGLFHSRIIDDEAHSPPLLVDVNGRLRSSMDRVPQRRAAPQVESYNHVSLQLNAKMKRAARRT